MQICIHLLTVEILVFLINRMAEKPASDHWIGLFASESSWLFWSDGQKRQYININFKVGTENLNYEYVSKDNTRHCFSRLPPLG